MLTPTPTSHHKDSHRRSLAPLPMAERGGFEPPVREIHVQWISNPPHSTALPPLRNGRKCLLLRGLCRLGPWMADGRSPICTGVRTGSVTLASKSRITRQFKEQHTKATLLGHRADCGKWISIPLPLPVRLRTKPCREPCREPCRFSGPFETPRRDRSGRVPLDASITGRRLTGIGVQCRIEQLLE